MNIIEMKIGDIKPYEKNPRRNDEAAKYVAASIKEFGFKVPIVIDKDNVIVAGHTRYKAAKNLGLEEVPCIVADDLTPEQVKAFRLADNKVTEKAEWDFELLNGELDDLFDFNMADFGFYDSYNEDEFEHLFESQAKEPAAKGDKDDSDLPTGWHVIIRAESEEEALQMLEDLQEQGYECEVNKL